MAEKRDFYEILEVDRGASGDDIKRAYKKLAKKYHPDLNPDDDSAEDKFKEVAEAYEILSNAEKKQRYDQFGHAGVDPSYGAGGQGGYGGGGGGFGGFDINDIFGDFFGGGGRSRRTRDPNAPSKGQDIKIQLNLEFMEAVHGVTKKVKYSRLETCESCHGNGSKPGSSPATCGQCHGSGVVETVDNIPFLGQVRGQAACPTCGGKGTVITDKCDACRGQGRVTKQSTAEIKIPPGIDNGQTMIQRGAGDAGVNNGPAGDLLIRVSVKEDAIFERDGFDIWCNVPLTYRQLVVGDEIVLPTVDGKVSYTVAAGTQPGTVVRLRQKGISHVQGSGKGDQYLRIEVEVPRGLNTKQKEALDSFDQLLTEKNYEKRKGFFGRLKDKFNK